jgi:hypothetical protein
MQIKYDREEVSYKKSLINIIYVLRFLKFLKILNFKIWTAPKNTLYKTRDAR